MMRVYKFEMKRAVKTSGFKIAMVFGTFLALIDFIQYGMVYARNLAKGHGLFEHLSYPCIVSESWICGGISKYAGVFFVVLPILAVLPFGTSYFSDCKDNIIVSICSRIKRKTYIRIKYLITFLTGGFVSVYPLCLNYLLCSSVLPGLNAQSASYVGVVIPKSSLSHIYYSNTTLYICINILMIFIFAGVMAVTSLYVSMYTNTIQAAFIFPFTLYLSLTCLGEIFGIVSWEPINFLNPKYVEPRLLQYGIVTGILFIVSVVEFIVIGGGHKDDFK